MTGALYTYCFERYLGIYCAALKIAYGERQVTTVDVFGGENFDGQCTQLLLGIGHGMPQTGVVFHIGLANRVYGTPNSAEAIERTAGSM